MKPLDQQAVQWRNYLALVARTRVVSELRGKADESDLIQQTLLEAHQGKAAFKGTSDAEYAAWLRQILARNLANLQRDFDRHKRNVFRERSMYAEIEKARSRIECLAANQSSIGTRIDRAHQAVRLANAMAKLPEDQRLAIELRHLQGLTLKQVAENLDRSSAAVAGLLHRGLTRLRSLLNDAAAGE